jgi:hypothetical protein
LADQIRSELFTAGNGYWSNIEYEIQDGGKNLFIIFDVPKDLPPDSIESIKEEVKLIIGPKMPPIIDRIGTWTVGIRQAGQVVDSVDSLHYKYDILGRQYRDLGPV